MNSPTSSASSCIPWERIFEPATQSASVALGKWTRGRISLSLDEVRETSLDEVAASLPPGDEPVTMVIVGVSGEVSGQLILTFDDRSVGELIAVLLNRQVGPSETWGELEMSALAETGNIFGSAYLNAMSQCAGRRLLPSPPVIVRDYAAGALEQAVMMQALDSDEVLFCRTCLAGSGNAINVTAFFVPTVEMLALLRDSLSDAHLAAR
ncbi:MAG: chemotaxis protein [Pirellula sp.]|nr:chemotaxis protein [Pirellula sp.]